MLPVVALPGSGGKRWSLTGVSQSVGDAGAGAGCKCCCLENRLLVQGPLAALRDHRALLARSVNEAAAAAAGVGGAFRMNLLLQLD